MNNSEERLLIASFWLAMASILLWILTGNYVDQDLWHLMSLGRELVQVRAFPTQDQFAYTPTKLEFVHHEWGAGLLSYALAVTAGGTGIVLLKILLGVATAAVTGFTVRLGRPPLHLLTLTVPVSLILMVPGFGTLRPQIYSYLFFAVLLYCLALDRMGRRRWLMIWPVLFVVWLNVHGGFVLAFLAVGAEWLERVVRKEPAKHIFLLGLGMVLLIAVNPYGLSFYVYMAHAITMPRPQIGEWQPVWTIWHTQPIRVLLFAASIGLSLAGLWIKRRSSPHGTLLLLLLGIGSLNTQRLGFFFAIAFAVTAPALLEATRIDETMRRFWKAATPVLMPLFGVVSVVFLYIAVMRGPLTIRVPVDSEKSGTLAVWYPEGVVSYLRENRVQGNMMVQFTLGAYISWKLFPAVKVSMDSRYEAVYPAWLVEENIELYRTAENWEQIVTKYPTDMILVYPQTPLMKAVEGSRNWKAAYRDNSFALFVHADSQLPYTDRRGKTILAAFP